MGIEQPIMSGASKISGFFISPIGKINLWVTAILFLVVASVGVINSFEQHSAYPLIDATVLKIAGADSQISQLIDVTESSVRPPYDGVLSRSFPAYLWFWCKIIFNIVTDLWFMYFLIWLLFGFFQFLNSESQARSVGLALIVFIIMSMIAGAIIYNLNLAGKCLVPDRSKNFNAQMLNIFPLHGTVKLIIHIFNKDLFQKVSDWTNTGLGQAVANIPSSPNILNDTNVSVS